MQKAFPWKSLFPFSIVSSVAGSGFAHVLASSSWSIGTRGLRTASSAPKTGIPHEPSDATTHTVNRRDRRIAHPLITYRNPSRREIVDRDQPGPQRPEAASFYRFYLSEYPVNLCPRDCGKLTVPSGNS